MIRVLAVALIVSGLCVFGYVGYQVWITPLATEAAQERLETEFTARLGGEESSTTTAPAINGIEFDPDDVPVMTPPASAAITVFDVPGVIPEEAPAIGVPVGSIAVASIELSWMIVEGVTPAQLREGPGHMPGTPLPGQAGNAVVSGHRTTNGAPFRDLDLLGTGDLIEVRTMIGTHTYEYVETLYVAPGDFWVAEPRDGAWLTLTSCHPKLSSRQRIVVVARLIGGPNWPVALMGGV